MKVNVPIFGQDLSTGRGVDAGNDSRHEGSRWIIAENAVFPRRNAITKRNGFTRSASTSISDTVVAPTGVPYLIGGTNVVHYDKAVDAFASINPYAGPFPVLTSTIKRLKAIRLEAAVPGLVELWDGGSWCGVLRTDPTSPGLLRCDTYDWDTGALLATESCGAFSTYYPQARFVTVGTATSLIIANGTALQRRDITSAGIIGAAATIDASCAMTAYTFLDACVVGTRIAIVHYTGTVWRVTLSGASGAATYTNVDIHTTAAPTVCAIWPDGTTSAMVCYGSIATGTSTLYARLLNVPALTDLSTAVTIDSVTSGTHAIGAVTGIETEWFPGLSASFVMWSKASTTDTSQPPTLTSVLAYDNSGALAKLAYGSAVGYEIWSKPAHVDATKVNAIFGAYSQTWSNGTSAINVRNPPQPTLWMMTDAIRPVGCSLPSTARIPRKNPASLLDPQATGTLIVGAMEVAEVMEGLSTEESRHICALRFTLNRGNAVSALRLGDSVLIGGQQPRLISGGSIIPLGYPWYPDNVTVISSGNVGGLAVGRLYKFRLVWEFYDSLGRLFRSAPSPTAVEYTPSVSTETQPTVTALAPSSDAWSTMIAVVYRTEGNKTTFHRSNTGSPSGGIVSIIVSGTDAEIADNEILYTDDGSLEIGPAPPFHAACWHKGRFFVSMIERPFEIRYSIEVNLLESPGFHESLAVTVPDSGGAIVALEAIGGVLYAFTESAVWAIEGEPAVGDGTGATFTHAFKVEGAPGCKAVKSVIAAPGGILYQAQDGAVWIVAGGQATPIGDRVRYYTDTYGSIIGAALFKAKHVVVFALQGASAPLLVYDWLHDEWAQWTVRSDTKAICAADETLLRLDTSNYIWRMSDSSWADVDSASRYIPLHLRTGHIYKGGIASGWQRVHEVVVGGYKHGTEGFNFSVGVAVNAEPSFSTITKNVADLTAFGHDASFGAGSSSYEGEGFALRYQLEMVKQRASAIMIDIVDSEASTYGAKQGFTLTDMALRVSSAPGVRRVGEGRNITGA